MSDVRPDHAHPHSRAPRAIRARPALRASWLRDSALRRLAMAGGAIVLLWAAVAWALQ